MTIRIIYLIIGFLIGIIAMGLLDMVVLGYIIRRFRPGVKQHGRNEPIRRQRNRVAKNVPGYPRTESILCPECLAPQRAVVDWEEWMPRPARVHTCGVCGHVIMESEWDVIKSTQKGQP